MSRVTSSNFSRTFTRGSRACRWPIFSNVSSLVTGFQCCRHRFLLLCSLPMRCHVGCELYQQPHADYQAGDENHNSDQKQRESGNG